MTTTTAIFAPVQRAHFPGAKPDEKNTTTAFVRLLEGGKEKKQWMWSFSCPVLLRSHEGGLDW